MKERLSALLIASALFAVPSLAWSQCVTVDPVSVTQVRVDPLDAAGPAELVQPFMITFRRTGSTTAPLALRYQIVDDDSSVRPRVGLSQGPLVEWQGEDSTRNIGAFRSETYSLLRSGEVAFRENELAVQETVNLRLTDLRADLAAGIYREQFTIRYWCGEADSTAPFEANGAIAVSVAIPNVLSANVAGASVRGQIDFMDFAQLSRTLQVSVRSTGPYKVTAHSLNGGELRRDGAVTVGPADRIQYTATFDGQPLNLAGSEGQRMSRAGLAGRQMALNVDVEKTDTKRAGLYADTLVLTLAPGN